MTEFQKVDSIDPIVDYIAQKLIAAVDADKRTVWLVPGGSCTPIVLAVAKRLAGHDVSRLAITLTDERYGEAAHLYSNWTQLEAKGFELPGAFLLPVLTGQDRATTTARYDALLKTLLDKAEYKLGLFGIGADGHTAGILPGSPAVKSKAFATDYDAGTYERITMTPRAIKQLDEAVVYAIGEAKAAALDELATKVPLAKQPAQILKQVPVCTIFNDHKGAA